MRRILHGIKRSLRGLRRSPEAAPQHPAPPLEISAYESRTAYNQVMEQHASEWQHRREIEQGLIPAEKRTWVNGYCQACGAPSLFLLDFQYAPAGTGNNRVPNWRERLVCQSCDLNNRVRASLSVFEQVLRPEHHSVIYITEQTTPLYQHLRRRYPNVIGSEFLSDEHTPGEIDAQGLRHEDFTRLSFQDAELGYILTFDVLEHVPDYPAALRESYRCLRPGGQILISVPFRSTEAETLVRARLKENGAIEHLEEPEYHGDPVNPRGCLCFYHFGWDLLDRLRDGGFEHVRVLNYWSREHACLGANQLVITASKPTPAT